VSVSDIAAIDAQAAMSDSALDATTVAKRLWGCGEVCM
jgi:hypothetical protein